jgi:hypothetical protein
MYVSYISNTAWDDKPILHIILFVRKNLKTPKSNGVTILSSNTIHNEIL